MGVPEKPSRRGSAGAGSDGVEKASRRRSTGVGTAEPFDPFSTKVTEALEEAAHSKKKSESGKVRRTPARSASVGALLPSSGAADKDDDPFDDDDMMFDEVDWNNVATADAPQKKKEKSRRQSLTNKSKDEGSDDYDSKDEGDEEKKERSKRKSSTKSKKQSSDSTNDEEDADDGFGPIKTYGFTEDGASSDRRKGLARAKSVSGDHMHDESRSTSPKRGIHRRRSETMRSSRRKPDSKGAHGPAEPWEGSDE